MMRLYFDANALIKFYRDEPGSQWLRREVARHPFPVLLSSLTIVEFYGVLALAQRSRRLRPSQVKQLDRRLRRDLGVRGLRPFERISIGEQVWDDARTVLLNHGGTHGIGSKDSLHVAAASGLQRIHAGTGVLLVTSDVAMKSVCKLLHLPTLDPQIAEAAVPIDSHPDSA